MERQRSCLYRVPSRRLSPGLINSMNNKLNDNEAAVLIDKLVKWHRFFLIFGIVFLVLFLIAFWDSGDIGLRQVLIFFGVGGILSIISSRFMRCPFCRKNVRWIPDRSGGRSGKWPHGYFTPLLPKKCPQCSRPLRVKKKKKEGAATRQK